jgi:hypothetical protein
MLASFAPLSAVPPEAAKRYLVSHETPQEIVDWKYFDERFNCGRERGYAWFVDGKVLGFIGLIPFDLDRGGATEPAAWTCDWSVADPKSSGAMGLLLLKYAYRSFGGPVFNLGGNQYSRRVFSRIAAHTFADAGVTLYAPLRGGAILRALRRRIPQIPASGLGALNRVPLWRNRRRPALAARFDPGVSRAIAPLLVAGGGWRPRYDFEYVDWQIGRCPALLSATCYAPADSPQAAAALWRTRQDPGLWRAAIWAHPDAREAADSVAAAALEHAYENQGEVLSILVSRLDRELAGILRRRGFFTRRPRRPLDAILNAKGNEPFEELHGLSFLDTDLAHRF